MVGMSLAAVEPMTGAVRGTSGLVNPPPKFGFFETCLAAVAVGGAAGAATTSLQRGWDPKVANPTLAKSFKSSRQVKLIAPNIKGNTVRQGAQFVSLLATRTTSAPGPRVGIGMLAHLPFVCSYLSKL